jgi:hypothetical protein
MICCLTHLEPRFEGRGTILLDEMDEISEVLFITKGKIDIGYVLNYKTKYVIRLSDNCLIGAYCCSYNKRATNVYRCKTDCFGYFIRKEYWNEMMETENGEFKKYML